MGVSTRPYFFTLCVCVRWADKWGHGLSSVGSSVWGAIAERAIRSLINPWKPGRKLSTEGRLLGWTDSGYHYIYTEIYVYIYTYTYIHIFIYIHTQLYLYIDIYIYIHTQSYISGLYCGVFSILFPFLWDCMVCQCKEHGLPLQAGSHTWELVYVELLTLRRSAQVKN